MPKVESAGTVKAPKACYEEPTNVSMKADYYDGICIKMSGDDHYTGIAAKISAAKLKVEVLRVAILDAQSGTEGTVSVRIIAETKLKNDMDSLLADIQTVANNDPENAIANITKLGVSYRIRKGYTREEIEVRYGKVTGSFDLLVKQPNGKFAVVWFITTEPMDENSWRMADFSHNTTGSIHGLMPGVKYYFRAKVSSSVDGKSDWTKVIEIMCL